RSLTLGELKTFRRGVVAGCSPVTALNPERRSVELTRRRTTKAEGYASRLVRLKRRYIMCRQVGCFADGLYAWLVSRATGMAGDRDKNGEKSRR
ncbi:hypothetical protein K0M31_019546, partial [Melipona bicolor]